MRKSLLATVAIAALFAGPALAQRQEAPASAVQGAAPPPAAIQNAPAEKIAPAGPVAPDRAADTNKPGINADTQPAPNAPGRSGAAPDTRASGNSASLSADQKAKIRTTVLTANAPRVTNVNFSISIGTAVPGSVRLVAVPAPLVEIHPAWRGYMYFVHGDDLVIVEPGTMKIVAVVTV